MRTLLFLLVLLSASIAEAAGTVTVTEVGIGMRRITWAWTATAGGAADKVTVKNYYGVVSALVTVPATAGDAPSANYDIVVEDANAVDVLDGVGANRHTANTEKAVPTAISPAFGVLNLKVTNAGNAKKGVAILYIDER